MHPVFFVTYDVSAERINRDGSFEKVTGTRSAGGWLSEEGDTEDIAVERMVQRLISKEGVDLT